MSGNNDWDDDRDSNDWDDDREEHDGYDNNDAYEYQNGQYVSDDRYEYQSGQYVSDDRYEHQSGQYVSDDRYQSVQPVTLASTDANRSNDDIDGNDDLYEYQNGQYVSDDQYEYQNGQYVGSERYQFNITGGQVTGVVEYDNGRADMERMEWDEQWVYRDGQVIKTERDDGYLETTVYADTDGDGFFTKISEGHDPVTTPQFGVMISDDQARYVSGQYVGDDHWAEGYRFTFANGGVTQVVEVDNGRERVDTPDWNESWVVQGANVLKVETYAKVSETSVYADLDGDGIYTKILEQYGSSATDPSALMPAQNQLYYAAEGAQSGLVTVYGDEGIADDIYLTYEAAFNREADASGLGYWVAQAKQGMTLTQIAQNFLLSHEFATRYGDSMTNGEFVEALYQNVLDRSSDREGYEYWVESLTTGRDDRSEVLASFANSPENVTNLSDSLAAGIQYSAFVA